MPFRNGADWTLPWADRALPIARTQCEVKLRLIRSQVEFIVRFAVIFSPDQKFRDLLDSDRLESPQPRHSNSPKVRFKFVKVRFNCPSSDEIQKSALIKYFSFRDRIVALTNQDTRFLGQ